MTKAELIAALAALPDHATVMVCLGDDPVEVASVEAFPQRSDHPDSKPFVVLSDVAVAKPLLDLAS